MWLVNCFVMIFNYFILLLLISNDAYTTSIPYNSNTFVSRIQNGFSKNIFPNNTECTKRIKILVDDLINSKEWAIKMFDSSSKMPAGLTIGNRVDFGFYDQCLDVTNKINETMYIFGKYCQIKIPLSEFEPKWPQGTLTISICIPHSCEGRELNTLMNQIFELNNLTVPIYNCHIKYNQSKFTRGEWFAIVFFSAILALMFFGTIYDLHLDDSKRESCYTILIAFSVYSNGKKLTTIRKNPDILPCVEGIRFLSMACIILIHENVVQGHKINFVENIWSMTLSTGIMAVDTFFLLGGLMVSYNYLLSQEKVSKFSIRLHYLHRYIRLTPALAAAMIFYMTLFRHAGDGPQWPGSTDYEQSGCHNYWWSLLLYTQNYINLRNRCIQQSWYLCVDMQLFLVSPLILIPLRKWPRATLFGLNLLVLLGVVIDFYVAYVYKITGYTYRSSWNNPAFVSLYYFNTLTRFGPWVIGIILGYYIWQRQSYRSLNKVLQNRKISYTSLILSCAILLIIIHAPYNMRLHPYNQLESSFFIAIHRVVWAIAVAWIIYVCVDGNGGIVNGFLSIDIFQVLGKLTYSMFIVHFAVSTIKEKSRRLPIYYTPFNVISAFWDHLIKIVVVSVFWHLAFEMPVALIEKNIFKKDTTELPGKRGTKNL